MDKTFNFSFQIPQNILFGIGKKNEIQNLLGNTPKKIAILTGSGWFYQEKRDSELKKILGIHDCRFVQLEKNEPTIESINTALAEIRTFSPDYLIAIGGGTVLDSAKALSGLLTNGGEVLDYLEGIGNNKAITQGGLPWIAMPTTAGTGSEVTKNAVIKSNEHGVKKSMRSHFLLPQHVIIDPELHVSAPAQVSAYSGLDAVVQLFESYVSKKAQPMPSALVADCFFQTLNALEELSKDLKNLDNRTVMAYGSMISGIALANSGLGAVHGFASSVGGKFDIPHGQICALFFNPVLEHNRPDIISRVKRLLHGRIGDKDPIDYLKEKVLQIIKKFKLPENLKHLSISRQEIREIAEKTSGSSMSGNPSPMSVEERCRILEEVFSV